MTLTDFLLARIGEDEAAAKAATEGPWSDEVIGGEGFRVYAPAGPDRRGRRVAATVTYEDFDSCKADAAHIARHDPARVLAECEAKRRIVEDYQTAVARAEADPLSVVTLGIREALALALKHLAAVHADHPDFDPTWRP